MQVKQTKYWWDEQRLDLTPIMMKGDCQYMQKNQALKEHIPNNNKTEGTIHRTSTGNEYIVKNVFLGDKDVKTLILELAERKAIKEMGLI